MLVPSITCDHCGKHDQLLYCFGKDKGVASLYFHEHCIYEGLNSLRTVLENSDCNSSWKNWNFDKLRSVEAETCTFIDPSVEMRKSNIWANIQKHQFCLENRTHYFSKDTSKDIIKVIVTWDELFT